LLTPWLPRSDESIGNGSSIIDNALEVNLHFKEISTRVVEILPEWKYLLIQSSTQVEYRVCLKNEASPYTSYPKEFKAVEAAATALK
jgi:hypothetical protein